MASSHLTIGSGDRHVMALHGWFGSARGWGSLPEYLDGSAFTYVFPDLRGYGGRRDVTGEFTMAEAAEIAGIGQAAFKSRLHQARLRVRAAIGDEALASSGG